MDDDDVPVPDRDAFLDMVTLFVFLLVLVLGAMLAGRYLGL